MNSTVTVSPSPFRPRTRAGTANGSDVDPRLVAALADARKGEQLLETSTDKTWATSTIQQIEEYMR